MFELLVWEVSQIILTYFQTYYDHRTHSQFQWCSQFQYYKCYSTWKNSQVDWISKKPKRQSPEMEWRETSIDAQYVTATSYNKPTNDSETIWNHRSNRVLLLKNNGDNEVDVPHIHCVSNICRSIFRISKWQRWL